MERPSHWGWKRAFKAINLFEHLIKYGPEAVINDGRQRSFRDLIMFQCYENIGGQDVDRGSGIRTKITDLKDIVDSDAKINEFRKEARKLAKKLGSFSGGAPGSGSGFGSGEASDATATFNPYSTYNSESVSGGSRGGYMDNSFGNADSDSTGEQGSDKKKKKKKKKKEKKEKKTKKKGKKSKKKSRRREASSSDDDDDYNQATSLSNSVSSVSPKMEPTPHVDSDNESVTDSPPPSPGSSPPSSPRVQSIGKAAVSLSLYTDSPNHPVCQS